MYRWLLLFSFLGSFLYADLILLKNGNEFQGRIISETKTTLELEVAFGKVVLKKADILKIIPEDPVKNLLKEGEEYLRYRSYPEAIERFAKALKEDQKSEPARDLFRRAAQEYGKLLLENGNYSLAQQFFKEIKEHFPEEDFADVFLESLQTAQQNLQESFAEARKASATGNWKDAVALYVNLVQKSPGIVERFGEEIAVAHAKLATTLPQSEFETRLYHFEEALRLHPKISYQIEKLYLQEQFRVVDHAIQASQYQAARSRLLNALDFAPNSHEIRVYLGWVYENLGEESEARRHYGWALNIIPNSQTTTEELRTKALAKLQGDKKSLPTTKAGESYWEQVDGNDFITVETASFKVFAKNKRVAEEVAEASEHYLQKTRARLDPSLSRPLFTIKCEIYIYPNRAEYQQFVGESHEWTGGITQHQLLNNDLKAHRIVAFQSASSLIRFVLPHEITHVLFRYLLGYSYRPPLCLVEGVAMREEQNFQQENLKDTYRRARKDGSFLPAEKILTLSRYPDTSFIQVFYAESFMIADYLIDQYGVELFFQYCRAAHSNNAIEILKKLYGLTPQELDQQMELFAGTK